MSLRKRLARRMPALLLGDSSVETSGPNRYDGSRGTGELDGDICPWDVASDPRPEEPPGSIEREDTRGDLSEMPRADSRGDTEKGDTCSDGSEMPRADLRGDAAEGDAHTHPSRAWESGMSAPGAAAKGDHDREGRLTGLRRMLEDWNQHQAARNRARAGSSGSRPQGPRGVAYAGTLRTEKVYLPPDYAHGKVQVARALKVDPAMVAGLALDPQWKSIELRDALFLDTETTGLGGGTGVVPFLVGLAWFEEDALVIEQLLLEELGDEGELLEQIHRRMEGASCIVTYNGKSYDRPLLDARVVMNRRPPLPIRPHLDLLHCSRRVYKPRLRQVRLVDMEARVLGMRREGDIDGREIPSLYWSYLRGGGADLLDPVVEHNANDVAALAAILAVLAERYATLHREDDPRDQLARARVGVRCRHFERAEAFAAAAAEGGGKASVTAEAHELLGRLRLRRGEVEGAREAFESGLATLRQPFLRAGLHLQLSKLLEHRLKRFDEALSHAEHTSPAEGPEGCRRRVARLRKRCGKQVGLWTTNPS